MATQGRQGGGGDTKNLGGGIKEEGEGTPKVCNLVPGHFLLLPPHPPTHTPNVLFVKI